MRCPIQTKETAELLLAYCARKLEPETRAVLERHMERCPECRAFAEQQKAVWEALDAWEGAPVSEDFDVRLFARIERDRRTSRRARLRLHVPVAAASLLLAAVLWLRSPWWSAAPESEDTSVVEVETVEAALEDIEMLRALELLARADVPGSARM